MKHLGVFEGLGGFSLAAKWMEWETVAWCEINPFCQKILKHHFPLATGHEDIRKTDFTIYGGLIDVFTGGFPCQPYSQAGKQLGSADSRHLWPEMLRAIQECKPAWVIGENVPGLINWNGGVVFEQVLADLENEGYEVQPFVLPAAGVNAPHKRDRVWIIAYSEDYRCDRRAQTLGTTEQRMVSKGVGPGSQSGGYRRLNSNTSMPNEQRYRLCEKCEKQQVGRCDTCNAWFTEWPTQPPLCNGNDGFPRRMGRLSFSKWRNETIKAAGNAIVPQIAYQIFKAIDLFR